MILTFRGYYVNDNPALRLSISLSKKATARAVPLSLRSEPKVSESPLAGRLRPPGVVPFLQALPEKNLLMPAGVCGRAGLGVAWRTDTKQPAG